MHWQLRHSSIHSTNACVAAKNWTYCRSARTIVSNDKFLGRGNACFSCKFTNEKACRCICAVPLIWIWFHNNPSIQFWRVIPFMLTHVIWVLGMRLVDTEDKWLTNWCSVKIRMNARWISNHWRINTTHSFWNKRWCSTLSTCCELVSMVKRRVHSYSFPRIVSLLSTITIFIIIFVGMMQKKCSVFCRILVFTVFEILFNVPNVDDPYYLQFQQLVVLDTPKT